MNGDGFISDGNFVRHKKLSLFLILINTLVSLVDFLWM